MIWQIQEAKQRFSEVLRAAETGEPQIVTKHGQEVVVIIDFHQYRHLVGDPRSFVDYLRAEPHLDADLDLDRSRELPREIDFGA